jgi:rhamnopyranosyl-N-acetylglucosaminyl-diphospho-decaprenol beta-1,3/1,4-galactofuranosyltransferase
VPVVVDGPRVLACILSHNSVETLRRTLETVAAQTLRPGRIVVVDNASADGTVEEVRAMWPQVEVLALPENLGVGAGHNAGWRLALDDPAIEAVWALEHDTWPTPGCLEHLVATWRANDRPVLPVGAVHPRQVVPGGEERAMAAPGPTGASPLLHLNGALLPVAALRAVGLLREDFFVSHEDRELGWRLVAAGWLAIHDGDAIVVHRNYADARGSRQSVFRRYYGWRNDAYVRVKVRHDRLARVAVIGGTILTSARILRSGPRRWAYLHARVRATVDALRADLGAKNYRFLRSR